MIETKGQTIASLSVPLLLSSIDSNIPMTSIMPSRYMMTGGQRYSVMRLPLVEHNVHNVDL